MGISRDGSVMISGIGFQPMDESKHGQDAHATRDRRYIILPRRTETEMRTEALPLAV